MIGKSYAKINLSLNVLNKSKPKEMHNLDMINVCINLKDYIKIKFLDDEYNDIVINSNNEDMPKDNDNLVYKVIEKFQKQFNMKFSCHVYILKNIPLNAGLAGGSSNAACVLKMLNRHFKTNMSLIQQARFIEPLTSDGPYMVVSKLSRVKGSGNVVEPINKSIKGKLFIVKPKLGCKTKEVFDNLSYQELIHPNINKVVEAIINDDINSLSNHVGNSLIGSATKLNDQIDDVLSRLKACGFEVVSMSGSGSTCFAYSKRKLPYKIALEIFKKENYDFIGTYKII